MLEENTLKIGSNARGNISLLMILLMVLDFIFVKLQEANQQNTFFEGEVRNILLAPFNAKCLFLKLKFLTEVQQEPPNQTIYPHYYYNYCFPCSLKFLVTTFKEGV